MQVTLLSRALLAALLSTGISLAWAKSGASGTVTIEGTSWPVADAAATLEGDKMEIVFAQKPFDRDAWADDGEFGFFDLMEFKDNAARDAQSLTITLDKDDGSYAGHNVKTATGGGGGFDSAHDLSVKLTARDDKHVAGTLKMTDDPAAEISFDLPFIKYGPMARVGTPLPSDGGEPGKALLAVINATHAGNFDQMLALTHPDRRERMQNAKTSGETAKMLEMQQKFTPKISKITGGGINGDKAWIEFEGADGGGAMKGSATLNRVDGQWYVKGLKAKRGG